MARWALVLRTSVQAPSADAALRSVMAFVDPASGLAFEVDYEATDESVVADDAAEIADDESVPGWRRLEA